VDVPKRKALVIGLAAVVAVIAQAAPQLVTPTTKPKLLPVLTKAQLAVALTPPTPAKLKAMLHRNLALEKAVNKAQLEAGGTGGTGGTAGTTTPTPASLPPWVTSCDWDTGLWLTYRHPVATATLPPSAYAGYAGLWFFHPEQSIWDAVDAQYEYQFRNALPCAADVVRIYSDQNSLGVGVWLLPDKPGVYTIAMNLVSMSAPTVDWYASMGTYVGKVVGITQCDQELLTYVQIDAATLQQMQSLNFPAVVYMGTKQPRDWSIGGASITR
jgi:hypothetical protein